MSPNETVFLPINHTMVIESDAEHDIGLPHLQAALLVIRKRKHVRKQRFHLAVSPWRKTSHNNLVGLQQSCIRHAIPGKICREAPTVQKLICRVGAANHRCPSKLSTNRQPRSFLSSAECRIYQQQSWSDCRF
jgi:hypothetical protein